jgi:CspA family cold shock protein
MANEEISELEAVRQGYRMGAIKWFDDVKGYGFIVDDEGGPDIFCHATMMQKAEIKPTDGMRIAFKARQGPKGLAVEAVAAVKGSK